MNTPTNAVLRLGLGVMLAGGLVFPASAQIVNGGFEAGLSGWTKLDQTGSDGTFFVQSGAASPLNAFPVPSPPEGIRAAMTDAAAGGSHVLYQDIAIPLNVRGASLAFDAFVNSGNAFFAPANLDWAATNRQGGLNLNQQARVDFLTTTADPFSVGSNDVLLNVFQTRPTDPTTAGYFTNSTDLAALFAAHGGETLRLRFAEVDNVSFFNFGVDNVRLSLQTVPEPGSVALLMGLGSSAAWLMHSAKRRKPKP